MKRTIVTLSLILLSLYSHAIFFKHIGVNEGLSQLSVMAIHQDKLGRMWFGTYEGVSIYDGEKMTTFKPLLDPDKFPEAARNIRANFTFPIVSDKNHNVYLKTNYTLVKYNIYTEEMKPISTNVVTALESINGEIWFACGKTIYRWNDETEASEVLYELEIEGTINKIHLSSNQILWIGTSRGLYRKTHAEPKPVRIIENKDIAEIYETSQGDIWIGCRMLGMYKIDRNMQITEFLHQPGNPNSIASNQVRTFLEDDKHDLWIGTFAGLQKYEQKTGKFTLYTHSKQPGSLSHASVFSLCKDTQGSIWVGTYFGGVNYFNPDTDLFSYYTDDPARDDCLSYSFVGKMVEDKNQDIWICTEGGGLNKLNRKTQTFTHFMHDASGNSIAHNNLKSIVYHPGKHCLYIGTHTGGLSKYDISNNRFTNYMHKWEKTPGYSLSIINDIKLRGDSLLVMARNGLYIMDVHNETIKTFFPQNKDYLGRGLRLFIDSKQRMWIAQNSCLYMINLNKPDDIKQFTYGNGSLGNFQVTSVCETLEGTIYISTHGSGIYKYLEEENAFKCYNTTNSQLISNFCYDVAQTQQGHILVSNDSGVAFFDVNKNSTQNIKLGADGLILSAINDGCGILVAQNGEIFVGGADGLTSFFESDLKKVNKQYNIYFSQLQISNEVITPNDDSGILSQSPAFTEKISLNHKQNNLIFSFASNNYIGMLQNTRYEYMLEGFDNDWISTTKTSIYYTNLNPGNYKLRVREKNINTPDKGNEIGMNIHIKSPFYANSVAYIIYAILILIFTTTLIYNRYTKVKLKASLEFEKKEKEHIEELNQAKLRFFTNISHEFRTPLTLIISQIELLLQNSSLSPNIYNKILKVYKHTYQMRRLISELLDFRKFEQKHVTLNIAGQDIVAFLKETYLTFYEYATARHISYNFQAKPESIHAWFDAQQMQKVVYNLLSNAFKYTRPNGSIEIIVNEEEDIISIQVVDNGIGIEEKDVDKIFERFYQGGDTASSVQNTGTGIGLALTKNIVESHHGTLSVKSQAGYGSIFTIELKKGKAHFENDPQAVITSEKLSTSVKPDSLPDPLFMETMVDAPQTTLLNAQNTNEYTILIVEDHEELLQTLVGLFSPLYRVIQARDGEEGLEKALHEQPDLILSDVMMPRMTGTEMCMRIKSNIDLCHIPVVLLTALTSNEQNMEGLQRGADDYIGKPFNAKFLIVRCNNLIRNRQLIQSKYGAQTSLDTKLLATNQLDQNFIVKVEGIIMQELDNPEFDVNQLAKEMALGRSTLFAKFKGLTGMTPNEFILNYKLKYAATLLQNEPDTQISDISDRLGFSSPRYFSKCFKAQFNVAPGEFRKKG